MEVGVFPLSQVLRVVASAGDGDDAGDQSGWELGNVVWLGQIRALDYYVIHD